MSMATIHWRTEWSDGSPTFIVTFTAASPEQRDEIERIADDGKFVRDCERWRPTRDTKLHRFFQQARTAGFDLDFEPDDRDAPFDLQRLHLKPETRESLERMENFRLDELFGSCPVQAEGQVDAQYFYFRARGSHWRFEVGGNSSGAKGAVWWWEEYWPNSTGSDAGYMIDEDAVSCILKSVERYRTEDRGRFERGHPAYERTTLEGWSIGALSLRHVVERLGISGQEAVEKAAARAIEFPSYAELGLKALASGSKAAFDPDEDEGRSNVVGREDE
ncbi:hypothetical protein [Agrobacterium tumefaciens]|uniref:hypothetical protein n=1 Tax=Agrobacterium tumefaciens TaxID=358 RepID=UPI0004707D1A